MKITHWIPVGASSSLSDVIQCSLPARSDGCHPRPWDAWAWKKRIGYFSYSVRCSQFRIVECRVKWNVQAPLTLAKIRTMLHFDANFQQHFPTIWITWILWCVLYRKNAQCCNKTGLTQSRTLNFRWNYRVKQIIAVTWVIASHRMILNRTEGSTGIYQVAASVAPAWHSIIDRRSSILCHSRTSLSTWPRNAAAVDKRYSMVVCVCALLSL